MRRWFLAATAMLAAGLSTAATAQNWDYFGEDDDGWRWQLDTKIDRRGDYAYVWARSDLPPGATKIYSPSHWYFKINCRRELYQPLRMIAYDFQTGRVREERSNPEQPGDAGLREPKGGSIFYRIVDYVCIYAD